MENQFWNLLFGPSAPVQLNLSGETASDPLPPAEYITQLHLDSPAREKVSPARAEKEIKADQKNSLLPAETPATDQISQKQLLDELYSPGIAVIDIGVGALSHLEKKTDVRLLRNYSRFSVWVRAAIDYHRRMLGQAKFELIPIDSTKRPRRIDKLVRTEIENTLQHPNEAEESYNTLKEKMVEDYLVIGHGCLELDLYQDTTVRGLRTVDAARIGFVKGWDGTDRTMPRFVQFKDKFGSQIERYLAHDQLLCLVNRPVSYTKLGFSHVEALHKAVMALLSGDEFLIKQIIQPTPSSLINLGEGVTKPQVDDFKYQLQQVREALAVVGGAKSAQVLRLSASAEEMKILDSQEWFVRQVAAIFGISTAKLKLAVDTSRANTESMFDDDLEAVTGELTRIEEMETSVFIKRFSYLGEINLQFFYPIMHRKDEQQQARIASLQTRQPWASPNEARTRTGEKPLEPGRFPYADEPTVVVGGQPIPMSIWTKQMQKLEASLEAGEEEDPSPEGAGDPTPDAGDETEGAEQ